MKTPSLFLLVLFILGAAVPALADRGRAIVPVPDYPPPPPPPIEYCPPENIHVQVWTDRSSPRIGDTIGIQFRVSRDSHVYIFSTDAHGITRQVFPNAFDPHNFVRAHRTYRLPQRGYQLAVGGPVGIETITAIATTEKFPWIAREYHSYSTHDPFPRVGSESANFYFRLEVSARDHFDSYKHEVTVKGSTGNRGRAIVPIPDYPPYRPPAFGQASTRINIRPPFGSVHWHTPRPPSHFTPAHPPARPGGHHGGGWGNSPGGHFEFHYGQSHGEGRLVIRSNPSFAQVFVNGVYKGETPEGLKLPAGKHRIELRAPGYKPWQSLFSVKPGDRKEYTIRLEPLRGWH